MIRRGGTVLLLVTLGACVHRSPSGSTLPDGGYRQTCRDAHVEGHRLKAICRTSDGGSRNAKLDLRLCDHDIVNDDGHLRCGSGGSGGATSKLPRGSYRKSCGDILVRDGQLKADCRRRNGAWRKTTVDVRECAAFANRDGHLVCE